MQGIRNIRRAIVENKLRPPVPMCLAPSLQALLVECWAEDPGARPSFAQIGARLEALGQTEVFYGTLDGSNA